MDPLSSMPLECLQHILQIIAGTSDIKCLKALLSTNKYLFSTTLPYLYGDIFKEYDDGFTRGARATQRQLFIRLLLKRVPVENLPKVVSLSYGIDTTTSSTNANANTNTNTTRPLLDYLTCIRHLHIDGPNIDSNSRFPSEPSLQLSSHTEIAHHFPTTYEAIYGEGVFPVMNETILYYEVCWPVANLILEQLESLTIPLIDARRYLANIHRLGKLTWVRFNLDKALALYGFTNNPIFLPVVKHANEAVQAMIAFVKEHQRLFKDRLKIVSIWDVGIWRCTSRRCPQEIQKEVARAAPPLYQPWHLSPFNWIQFVAHPVSTIELAYVREIYCLKPVKDWLDGPVVNIQELLRQCRALRTLHVSSLGCDAFQWAVQERSMLHDSQFIGGQGTVAHKDNPHSSHRLDRPMSLPLPPLAIVTIDYFDTIEEINDIAYAFSQTLESFTINCPSLRFFPPLSLPFGQGWVDLPRLTKVFFSGYWDRFIMDPDLLIHCPNLVHLMIIDNTKRYQLEDVFGARCRPALLEKLKHLNLSGWSALTFHPDMLLSTQRLEILQVKTELQEDCTSYFIPPVEDLDLYYGRQQGGGKHLDAVGRGQGEEAESAAEAENEVGEDVSMGKALFRPLWTWDWYLPSLERLILTSEFAYRFEFKMLMGCPCLEALDLDITSGVYLEITPGVALDITLEDYPNVTSGDYSQHVRVITEDDLFALPSTKFRDSGDGNNSASEAEEVGLQRIVASSVRTLRLTGSWHITDNLLLPLLAGTFPNLQTWTEQRWRGYSLAGLIHAIRTGGSIWFDVNVDLPEPSREEMVEFGLCTEKKRRIEEEKVGGGDGGGGGGRVEVMYPSVFFASRMIEYKVLLVVDPSRKVEDVKEESESDCDSDY